MEFTLEELEQEHTVLMGEAQSLLFTLEQLDSLQFQYASVGVSRNDVLSLEQISGSPTDLNPNYFTEVPSQTNLNLAMEGLLDKMNAGVMALFGVVIGVIIAAFVWISKLFRSSDSGAASANAALAAAQQQLNTLMVAEAALKAKVDNDNESKVIELYRNLVIPPLKDVLVATTYAALDNTVSMFSHPGSLAEASRHSHVLRYITQGVQYINPNDEIVKGMVYENFDNYLTAMTALIQPTTPTQETYNRQQTSFTEAGGHNFTAQPVRPILDLFAVKPGPSRKIYADGNPMSAAEYESLRKKTIEELRQCTSPQVAQNLATTKMAEVKGSLLNPETYRLKEEFDKILTRQAELSISVYFDTKAASGRINEIVKNLEDTKKKVDRVRNSGGMPDKARFKAFKDSLDSVREDAKLMSNYALFYDNFYKNQAKFFRTIYEGMKNVQRELESRLNEETSESLKHAIRESKKHPDEMVERLKAIADKM